MLSRVQSTYREYPAPFWTLMGASLVDQLGRFLLFPYFSLYITQRFEVGLTEVGILFAIFSIASMVGSFIGGAISDKFGRRSMLLFGLVASATSSLLMAIVDDLTVFYVLGGFVGLLSNAGGPAANAMVADLLPARQRAEGYGISRIVMNIAATVGPAIGGFLANINFLLLFIFDAVSSLITALIVYLTLPETKPADPEDQPEQSLRQTMGGYTKVFRDIPFIVYVVLSIILTIVYVQMNSTMPVFLRDQHGIPPAGYGAILSLNALIVVLFQFWVSRRVSHRAPLLMIALGSLFYALGFGMFGFGSSLLYFAFAMVVITIGEMILAPVGQALVALFSPEDMRGRYMAIFGFTWGISFAAGPLLAGYLTDNFHPNYVWYASFIIGMIALIGYILLHLNQGQRLKEKTYQAEATDATPTL